MKKIISLVLVMAMLLFVLTGCVKINYEVTLNENGSADVAFVYAFDKATLESMGASSEDMSKSMEEQSEENGFKIEAYSDEKSDGFRATKHIDNVADVSLQEAFGEENVKDSDANKIKIEKKGSKTVFSQNAEIDLSEMDESYASMLEMKYTVKLPVKADKNNAQEVSKDGKTLTWTLKAGEVNKVEFTATKGSNNLVIILAVVAALVVLGIVCVAVKGAKKDDKEEKEEPAEEPVVEEPEAEDEEIDEAEAEDEEEKKEEE